MKNYATLLQGMHLYEQVWTKFVYSGGDKCPSNDSLVRCDDTWAADRYMQALLKYFCARNMI